MVGPILGYLKTNRTVVLIFLLALALRLFFFFIVVLHEMPPLYDEVGYLNQGQAYEAIFDALISGDGVSERMLERAYGGGVRPPVAGIVYGVGILLSFSDNETNQLAFARLINVLISSVITIIVYYLTRLLVNHQAGLAATIAYAIYPSFISFSHYLWTETIFTLLLLLAVICYILSKDSMRFAVLCGFFIALTGLTHARALVYFAFFPIWIFVEKGIKGGIARSVVIGGTTLIVILPWLAVLYAEEGKFLPLANQGPLAFYNGNNPHTDIHYGASGIEKNLAFGEAEEYASENGITSAEALRILALEEIRSDPGLFFVRSLSRLRIIWSSDSYYIRHILRGIYPSMSPSSVYFFWGLGILSYLLLGFLVFRGVLYGRFDLSSHKILLLLLVAIGCALPSISVAYSRYNIPLQALLLPFVGAAVANRDRLRPPKPVLEIVFMVLLIWVVISALPPTFKHHIQPVTRQYASVANQFEAIFGS